MTWPVDLPENERGNLQDLLASCPHLTALAEHVRVFAELFATRHGADLEGWMSAVEASDLPACKALSEACARTCPPCSRG